MPVGLKRALITLSLLTGCAAARPSPAPISMWPNVPLAAMGLPRHATQLVTMTRDENTFDMTAMLESDDQRLLVVGLASAGPRLFKIAKTAAGVTGETSRLVPSSFRPEHLLADLELAFASSRSLHDAFASTGWVLVEQGLTRSAEYEGQVVSRVTRTSEDPWAGPLDLENVRYGYRLHVETLEHE